MTSGTDVPGGEEVSGNKIELFIGDICDYEFLGAAFQARGRPIDAANTYSLDLRLSLR